MVQDFAKTKPTAGESTPAAPAQGRGMLLTGLFSGLALGLLLGFLIYLGGLLPSLSQSGTPMADGSPEEDQPPQQQQALSEELEQAAARLQLDFYRELPNYEVTVDATPLEEAAAQDSPSDTPRQPTTENETSGTDQSGGYMIQAGAFQQEDAAIAQGDRLRELGLEVRVRQEALLGRTLFLVQTGPYHSREQLARVERILRNNNIESMRISLGSR